MSQQKLTQRQQTNTHYMDNFTVVFTDRLAENPLKLQWAISWLAGKRLSKTNQWGVWDPYIPVHTRESDIKLTSQQRTNVDVTSDWSQFDIVWLQGLELPGNQFNNSKFNLKWRIAQCCHRNINLIFQARCKALWNWHPVSFCYDRVRGHHRRIGQAVPWNPQPQQEHNSCRLVLVRVEDRTEAGT